jgi:hypothetical protein
MQEDEDMIIESDFQRHHESDSLEVWTWYGIFAGAEAYVAWYGKPFEAPWFEHRRRGREHEWWIGRLHVQWTPRGWQKQRVTGGAA